MDDNDDDNYDDDDGYEDDDNNDGDDTDVGRCWEDWLPSSCCLLIAGCRRHTTYICICNWKSCIAFFGLQLRNVLDLLYFVCVCSIH